MFYSHFQRCPREREGTPLNLGRGEKVQGGGRQPGGGGNLRCRGLGGGKTHRRGRGGEMILLQEKVITIGGRRRKMILRLGATVKLKGKFLNRLVV